MIKFLISVIRLPDSAFWFEPPSMVLWDEEEGYWSTKYFHDMKYMEDQSLLQVGNIIINTAFSLNHVVNIV